MRTDVAIRYGLFLVVAACLANCANAGVMVKLVLNPSSTAGGGATSTRSGVGSWQLYAIDDSSTDFGISSYNIRMSGTTSINHRAPVTTINDSNGDPQTAGFSLLRTATNVNPFQAAQALPGSTPFLITGFGQTASDFNTKATAIDPGAAVVGPTTSGVWGNYNSSVLTVAGLTQDGNFDAAAVVASGKKWIFLAEGTGPSFVTSVTSAVFTVFSNAQGASAATPVTILGFTPEPASAVLLLVGIVPATLSRRQRSRRSL